MSEKRFSFWQVVWKQFRQRWLGLIALWVIITFVLIGIYAPFLASSKPLFVEFEGKWYFPLFRYLFYPGFFSKGLDIFYNILMFTLPFGLILWKVSHHFKFRIFWTFIITSALQLGLFFWLILDPPKDPAVNPILNFHRQEHLQNQLRALEYAPLFSSPVLPSWDQELSYLNTYAQLNQILRFRQYKQQLNRFIPFEKSYEKEIAKRKQSHQVFPNLWNLTYRNEEIEEEREKYIVNELKNQYPEAKMTIILLYRNCQQIHHPTIATLPPWITCDFLRKLSPENQKIIFKEKDIVDRYEKAEARLKYFQDRRHWLEKNEQSLGFVIMPLLRPFHWEDDAGGDQLLNKFVSWWDLTRINRKDMVAALIFGTRISLSVGLLAIGLALMIGIPIGAFSGYYGGKLDLLTYRLIEIWESMPTFFMLLMIVAFFQSKSIFLVIGVIGLFGWTSFSRFVRGEFFRQKELLYVEACHALGYSDRKIIFSHLLPNAIPPLLTLVPFAIMGAITSEAGLSFLGLGEEGSNSWGVLMDEGRSAFPSESYLLWPPAILLTILLVAIALVGDHLRDALDPKLRI